MDMAERLTAAAAAGNGVRAALSFLAAAAVALGGGRPLEAGGGSYRKIESQGDVARWYSSRAEAFVGTSVHVHVSSGVFRKESAPEKRKTKSKNREYQDRGVPLLVSPRNPYFQQFERKRSSKGGRVCVKGRVERRPGRDGKAVAVLVVETVGAAGR